jgi:hypothetical protein
MGKGRAESISFSGRKCMKKPRRILLALLGAGLVAVVSASCP